MHLRNFLLGLAAVGATLASPRPTGTPTFTNSTTGNNSTQTIEPCAAVSQAAASYAAANPDVNVTRVPADIAMACLKSVPLDLAGDHLLVEELKMWWQFQADLEYLKNPPPAMADRQVDIMGSLDILSAALIDNDYNSEFDFMQDLWLLVNNVHDFHYVYVPDILNVFEFVRGSPDTESIALISISEDGQALPQIYNYVDVMKNNATKLPPAIKAINGAPVQSFLQALAVYPQYNDIDARFNQLLINQASAATGQELLNTFNANNVIETDVTVVEYADGTRKTYQNFAEFTVSFDGVVDGATFFQKFCTPQQIVPGSITDSALPSNSTPTAPQPSTSQTGYPSNPVVIHSEGILAGYYLEEEGYDDTAVLSVTSFEPSNQATGEFQDVVNTFLKKASRDQKTRLVIDLRNNGGGTVFLGFDLFHQLFPMTDIKDLTRIRQHEVMEIMANVTTTFLENFNNTDAIAACQAMSDPNANVTFLDLAICNAWISDWNYKLFLNSEEIHFGSADEYFGPYSLNGGNFTAEIAYNFSDPLTQLGVNITGYFNRSSLLNFTQPFASENITIVQDGGCGSTCAVFSELMKTEGKVVQVVMGGQPRLGPMQGVCGSKGAQVQPLSSIRSSANGVIDLLAMQPEAQAALNQTALGVLYNSTKPLERAAVASDGSLLANVNWRNNFRPGDATNTPLEFVYEAADCRLFYTVDMVRDVASVWKGVHDATWNNWQGCVAGSTNHPSSLSGGSVIGTSGNSSIVSSNTTSPAPSTTITVSAAGKTPPAPTAPSSQRPYSAGASLKMAGAQLAMLAVPLVAGALAVM